MNKAREKDINRILKERAKELSEVPADDGIEENSIEVIEFVLAYEKYAIESSYIDEVYPMKDFTVVPGTPSFVLGIINLRGRILSVIDIRRFFDLPVKGLSNLNRVLVVKTSEMELGILSDFILGVRRLPRKDIHPALPTLTGIRAKYLHGVTDEGLVVLDVQKMLQDEDIIVHEETDI
ncbi:purine-binding chemotaxis protein CheW [bacterium]|nr:purine-binding chemotaxis protein CheW [bacterium]